MHTCSRNAPAYVMLQEECAFEVSHDHTQYFSFIEYVKRGICIPDILFRGLGGLY